MTPNDIVTFLMRLPAVLSRHGETDMVNECQELLTKIAQEKATTSRRARGRRGAATGGAPKRPIVIELEPGWARLVFGAAAAHAEMESALASLGVRRALPKPSSLGALLSRDGAWHTLLETDNGTASLLVRYATEAEAAAHESGTDLAKASGVPTEENKT